MSLIKINLLDENKSVGPKSELKDLIRDIQHNLFFSVENINKGGCGIFALLLYNKLKPITPNIEVYLDEIESFRIDISIEEDNKDSIFKRRIPAPNHVFLRVDDMLVDGEQILWGIRSKSRLDGLKLISHQELKILVKYGYWNQSFNRKQTKQINNIINNNVKKYFDL